MGAAEAEERRPTEASEDLDRRTGAEDEAGGRAGRSGRRPGNMSVILPQPWLFAGQGMDNVFLKHNAL